MSEPTGQIHDLGYRHYDGPRLGPAAIRRSLFVDTLRGAYGLGRSGRSKVMPFVLLGVMLLPATIYGIVTGYVGLRSLPVDYTEYGFLMQVVITVFVGAQSPAAMSRDLRFRVAPLYFSRPISRAQYVQAKYAAMTTALFLLLALPLTTLLAGALLAELPVRDQLPDYLRALAGAAALAAVLAGIGLVVASLTPRRGLGVAAVVGVLLVLAGLQVTVRALAEEFGSAGFAGYAGLLSPFTVVDALHAGPLGGESVMGTAPEGVAMMTVFVATTVALVVGSYLALLVRYRRALA